jgi:hypothetical protein
MFLVSEADTAAIRAIFEPEGELSAAFEVRRRFPGITDNARARECARTIVEWQPIAPQTSGPTVGARPHNVGPIRPH